MFWRNQVRWYSAPDEGGGAASSVPSGGGASGGSAPAAPSGAASTPAPSVPSTPSTPSTPSAPSGGGQSGGGTPAAASPAAQQQWTGVREALASLGVDLRGQFQDDQAALAHLAMSYRQNQNIQPFVPYLQQYAQHGEQFQGWLRQQQQAAQQPAHPAWKPPEYDPRWINMVQRNPITNQLEPAPGAPPDVVQKLQAAEAHRRGFLEKLPFDPMGAMKEAGFEDVVRQMAEKIVQQQLGSYQAQQQASAFIQENTGWLHARDAQGQVVRDPMTGRQQLSQWGQRFAGYLQQLEPQYGAQAAQNMALTAIQRDFLYAQQQAASAPGAAAALGQSANEQFLQQAAAARQPNNAQAGAGLPTQTPGMTLRERMKRNMQAGGFNGDTVLATTR